MPSLKDYRNRIVSIKSTRKITSAMKMVAASKLKRAQEQAEASQPYARALASIMARVAAGVTPGPGSPRLLIGTGKSDVYLLIVVTSDRGLAAGFNSNLLRLARVEARRLMAEGKTIKLVTIGRKARDGLRREFGSQIVQSFIGIGQKGRIGFSDADQVTQEVLSQFDAGGFDVALLFYNEFRSVLVQKPTSLQLIPFTAPATTKAAEQDNLKQGAAPPIPYEFEPAEEEILGALLPRNLGVQIYRALLDSAAGEHGGAHDGDG